MDMEQTGFNEAKVEILELLHLVGPCTAIQVGLLTGRTPENASMNLMRYQRNGLLRRHTLQGREKIYELTERGVERLAWLQG